MTGADPQAGGGIVDLHCHLLPGLDDGPSTTEEAIALLTLLEREGVTRVAATPHVSDRYPTTAADIAGALERLGDALPAEVVAGAEVHPSRLADVLPDVAAYSLGGSGVVLIEANPEIAPGALEVVIDRLDGAGASALLAHCERCRGLVRHPDALRSLVRRGAFVQVTAGAVAGAHGGALHDAAWDLVRAGLVHCVSSDAHSTDWRPPLLQAAGEALSSDLGPEAAAHLLRDGPAALLDGRRPAPYVSPEPERSARWWRRGPRAHQASGRR
jgi:protein-tyrosine phosphatase